MTTQSSRLQPEAITPQPAQLRDDMAIDPAAELNAAAQHARQMQPETEPDPAPDSMKKWVRQEQQLSLAVAPLTLILVMLSLSEPMLPGLGFAFALLYGAFGVYFAGRSLRPSAIEKSLFLMLDHPIPSVALPVVAGIPFGLGLLLLALALPAGFSFIAWHLAIMGLVTLINVPLYAWRWHRVRQLQRKRKVDKDLSDG